MHSALKRPVGAWEEKGGVRETAVRKWKYLRGDLAAPFEQTISGEELLRVCDDSHGYVKIQTPGVKMACLQAGMVLVSGSHHSTADGKHWQRRGEAKWVNSQGRPRLGWRIPS